jgi:hypothetical protein
MAEGAIKPDIEDYQKSEPENTTSEQTTPEETNQQV